MSTVFTETDSSAASRRLPGIRVPAGRAPVRISPARLRYSCSYSGTPEPGSSAVVKWTMIVSSSFCRMPN